MSVNRWLSFRDIPHPLLSRRRAAVAIAFCAIAAALVLFVDSRWSTAVRGLEMRGDMRKGIELSEVFGHSLGAAGILLAVFVVAIDQRKAVWWAICLTALSGLTANLMKGTVARIRPHSVVLEVGESLSPSASQEFQPRGFWDSRQRSFPSGHAATAWGLAVGLSFVFPRGTLLFAAFAALASLQRVYSGAHYPSDVLAGAAIAFAWAWLLLSTRISYLLCTSDKSAFDSDQPSHRRGLGEST